MSGGSVTRSYDRNSPKELPLNLHLRYSLVVLVNTHAKNDQFILAHDLGQPKVQSGGDGRTRTNE